MKNQCQGCQAGWPIKKIEMDDKPLYLHIVKSGYEGERVICTKDRYTENAR